MASPSEDRSGSADETRITIKESENNLDDLVASLKDKLGFERHTITPKCCIFRAPKTFRNVNNDAFTPQAISIGPFHHCKSESYEAMENHKFYYLNALLSRSNSKTLLKDCVQELKELETKARACYAEHINLTSHEFVEMMLLDGCFILELFLRSWEKETSKEVSDPLFHNIYVKRALRDDLLLLENQLPFFVLDKLFNVIKKGLPDNTKCKHITFLELALLYFYDTNPESQVSVPLHLLDLALMQFIPDKRKDGNKSSENNGDNDLVSIPTATSLKQAGVKFGAVFGKHLLDIKFEKGVLEIPVIQVEDTTELLFRNMMAFEQCYGHSTYVADYTTLMDHLIDTAEDVALLRRRDIITSWLGDDEEVSQMFNKLGRDISSTNRFYYAELYKRLNAYYKVPWHKWKVLHWSKWMKILNTRYFGSPWSLLSFFAAVVILICTVIQTLYVIARK